MEHLAGTRIRREGTPTTVNLRRCKLVVIKGAPRGSELVVDADAFRVGKAADANDFALADETVSRVHFEIVRDAKGYLLRDLKSTNGTFLDGAEVKEAYLRPGSVIRAGACELRFTPFEERIEIRPSEQERLGELVGKSRAMRGIFGLVERIAAIDVTVLVEGEAGTGKDLIARTLHELSRRKDSSFVAVDCAAVAGTLIESELFGHEKGAFTGAVTTRQGALELASGGTVYLDEVGELSLDLQHKLLRALELREVRRVGGGKSIKIDPRVIAATRKDLRSEVEKGKFREDLYMRLNVVPIAVPALRERSEDIPLLVDALLQRLAAGGPPLVVSEASQSALVAHDWPGNVRELRDVLERSIVNASDTGALLAPLGDARGTATVPDFEPDLSFRETKERWNEQFERRYLAWLIKRSDGNISKAARDADMDRKYLHKLLRKYGITGAAASDDSDD